MSSFERAQTSGFRGVEALGTILNDGFCDRVVARNQHIADGCTNLWTYAEQMLNDTVAAGHPNGYPNNMKVGFDRKTVRHGHPPDSGR